ncbi:type II secretion system GspH family protein (plasmid) [Deinococcus sp. KNUC1210]|uniref:type II secretion system protein n=1 Tax=Deinococcus sp. KNUC1210 TaxID=2917691 RepID=UPI001EF1433A|nr:type II secretion system protein [Deinococcus sp. KNUC1210]ULH17280.1 type II secretion system GspH family protein [Deinococcus sp. KNUC1210]
MQADRQAGFTLVELLVSIAILAVLMSTLISAFLFNAGLNTKSEMRSAAVRVAVNIVENYRNDNTYDSLPLNGATQTSNVTESGRTFRVVTTFCPPDMPSEMVCSSSARFIRVEVYNGTTEIYQTDSYFTQLVKPNS